MGDVAIAKWLMELDRRRRRQRLIENIIGTVILVIGIAMACVIPAFWVFS